MDRLLKLGAEAYDKGRDIFYDIHDKSIPFITLDKTLTGITTLVGNREGPYGIQEASKEFDYGYFSAVINSPENANNFAAIELYASQWMSHVTFTWENDEHSLSPQKLREVLGFSTIELYTFLAYVLRDCLRRDNQYRTWSSANYVPALNSSQLTSFDDQIGSFNRETFSQWKAAIPVLAEYLHPNLESFRKQKRSSFASGLSTPSGEASCENLRKIFQEYLSQIAPTKQNTRISSAGASEKSPLLNMAEWFLSFRTEESSSVDIADRPFFIDRPRLIFSLFRSPVHRYLFNAENRNWNLIRVIEDACVEYPLPVTSQSIAADTKLFRGIVNICADMCRQDHVPFQKEAWDALWNCIVQCVQCLTFQIGDLFSVRNGFIHTLYLGNKGAPVIDHWIEMELTSNTPKYILIWRAFIKKWCNPSRKRSPQLLQAIRVYRSCFEDGAVNNNDALAHLDALCSQIKWTGIAFLPLPEKLAAICPEIKVRSRKGTADMIRHGRSGRESQVRNEFQRLWVEWLLVQCVCEQARRELMESVYLYLTKAERDPA